VCTPNLRIRSGCYTDLADDTAAEARLAPALCTDIRDLDTKLCPGVDPFVDGLRLASGEQRGHLFAALAFGVLVRAGRGTLEPLTIEHDFLELEGQVLVGLEADRLLQVSLGHPRHGHVAHDDGLSEHAGHDLPALELAVGKNACDGVGRAPSGGNFGAREAGDDGLRPLHRDLHGLDHGAAEVETDDALLLAEHGMPCSS
jgi:hypothetical protein